MRHLGIPLRIHCWGGLGSQLFTVAMAQKCQVLFPFKRVIIVLHTGGVTYRAPEILELYPDLNYLQINDYLPVIHGALAKKSVHQNSTSVARIKRYLRVLLEKSKMVLNADNTKSFEQIRFWTFSLRGHYSSLPVSEDFLISLKAKLNQMHLTQDDSDHNSCGIHYRLGDLVLLDSKKPTPLVAITNEFERRNSVLQFVKTFIFTDSPELATSIAHSFKEDTVEVPIASTTQTMNSLISMEYFIGTSSKISFWVAAIRSRIEKKPSSLPAHNRTQMHCLVEEQDSLINYYEIRV